ncbi:hypothetical protein MPTK2_4g08280 [Marchantia polymorpha subsp. ruderalis]
MACDSSSRFASFAWSSRLASTQMWLVPSCCPCSLHYSSDECFSRSDRTGQVARQNAARRSFRWCRRQLCILSDASWQVAHLRFCDGLLHKGGLSYRVLCERHPRKWEEEVPRIPLGSFGLRVLSTGQNTFHTLLGRSWPPQLCRHGSRHMGLHWNHQSYRTHYFPGLSNFRFEI